MFQFMLHSSVISKSLNLLPCPPPGTYPSVCRLRLRTRLSPTSTSILQYQKHDNRSFPCPPSGHPQKTAPHQLVPCFIFESIFLHQKGSTIMTKLTYTLAIINGTVCYECQPSTPHAFYSGGGWFVPFCTVLELTRKNTVKA